MNKVIDSLLNKQVMININITWLYSKVTKQKAKQNMVNEASTAHFCPRTPEQVNAALVMIMER